jgi:hypothetical protein
MLSAQLALSIYLNYRTSLLCALGLCALTIILQTIIIEKLAISDEWLNESSQTSEEEGQMHNQDFKSIQLDITRAVEEEGVWSKSSSMSTINLRDQPIIFDEKSYISHQGKKSLKDSTTFQLLVSFHFLSLMYQVMIASIIIGVLMVNYLTDE